MEERKEGKNIIFETVNESINISDGINLTITVSADEFENFGKDTRGAYRKRY